MPISKGYSLQAADYCSEAHVSGLKQQRCPVFLRVGMPIWLDIAPKIDYGRPFRPIAKQRLTRAHRPIRGVMSSVHRRGIDVSQQTRWGKVRCFFTVDYSPYDAMQKAFYSSLSYLSAPSIVNINNGLFTMVGRSVLNRQPSHWVPLVYRRRNLSLLPSASETVKNLPPQKGTYHATRRTKKVTRLYIDHYTDRYLLEQGSNVVAFFVTEQRDYKVTEGSRNWRLFFEAIVQDCLQRSPGVSAN